MKIAVRLTAVILLPCSALILAAAAAAPAIAQTGTFGIRAGGTIDPDQFHFGGHYETGPLIDKLTFKPNLELGFGDNLATVAFNFEFAYRIPIQRKPFDLYLGGGPALIIYNFDDRNGGGTEAEGGFNILLGLQHHGGLFGEFKVGAIDSPELKFTVGYTFR